MCCHIFRSGSLLDSLTRGRTLIFHCERYHKQHVARPSDRPVPCMDMIVPWMFRDWTQCLTKQHINENRISSTIAALVLTILFLADNRKSLLIVRNSHGCVIRSVTIVYRRLLSLGRLHKPLARSQPQWIHDTTSNPSEQHEPLTTLCFSKK